MEVKVCFHFGFQDFAVFGRYCTLCISMYLLCMFNMFCKTVCYLLPWTPDLIKISYGAREAAFMFKACMDTMWHHHWTLLPSVVYSNRFVSIIHYSSWKLCKCLTSGFLVIYHTWHTKDNFTQGEIQPRRGEIEKDKIWKRQNFLHFPCAISFTCFST